MGKFSEIAIEISDLNQRKDDLYHILANTTSFVQCKKIITAILTTKAEIEAIYRSVQG